MKKKSFFLSAMSFFIVLLFETSNFFGSSDELKMHQLCSRKTNRIQKKAMKKP